jgi:hypothetical protein
MAISNARRLVGTSQALLSQLACRSLLLRAKRDSGTLGRPWPFRRRPCRRATPSRSDPAPPQARGVKPSARAMLEFSVVPLVVSVVAIKRRRGRPGARSTTS